MSNPLQTELAKHKGVEIHGNSLRITFMWRRMRCRETLGLPVTKANIRHAAQLRAAVLHDIKMGTFDYARHFPESKHAANFSNTRNERLKALAERYQALKAVDITPDTESRYATAMNVCLDLLGPDRLASVLLPEDIQKLRVDLIEERATSTVNHYLAALAGFLAWCESNGYSRPGLAAACTRFEMSDREPDPLTQEEFDSLITKGCLHRVDSAAITLAVYTGLRPGELCALACEDINLDSGTLQIQRAITSRGTFKLPKTGKPRTVMLLPPALEACRTLLQWATGRKPLAVTVHLTRHESRTVAITPLLTPGTLARKKQVNHWFVPTAWNTKWAAIQKRAEIRPRRPYQTRHTYACWCLTARGNLAFISKQMGHKDFTMLVEVYAKWMDDESPFELERIWKNIKKNRTPQSSTDFKALG